MENFITLLCCFLGFSGIGQIYRGKLEESTAKTGGGTAMLGLGAIGVSVMNPVFGSTILNIAVTVIFTALSVGLVGWMFKDTHCDITYASLEAFPPEKDNPPKEIAETHIHASSSSPASSTAMPVFLDAQFSEKARLPAKQR